MLGNLPIFSCKINDRAISFYMLVIDFLVVTSFVVISRSSFFCSCSFIISTLIKTKPSFKNVRPSIFGLVLKIFHRSLTNSNRKFNVPKIENFACLVFFLNVLGKFHIPEKLDLIMLRNFSGNPL